MAAALGLAALMVAATYVNAMPPTATAVNDATDTEPRERVEVADLTDEMTQVFAEPDGTYTAELATEPVRVRKGDGWEPVDYTLIRRADGSIAPKASPLPFTLSTGGDSPIISMLNEDEHLELAWPERLPEPDLTDDTATYRDVLPGADLQVRASAMGYAAILVLHDQKAAERGSEVTLEIHTSGSMRDEGRGESRI